jgi:hypothetical protein
MMKKFRLNVFAGYFEVNPHKYRPYILGLMRHIAWLYGLEFAISDGNPFPKEYDYGNKIPGGNSYDMIYFRSTKHTKIEEDDLRKLVSCIAGKSFLPSIGIEISCLRQEQLRKHPFPKDYFRLLDYPLVEIYVDGKLHDTRELI